MAPMVVDMAYRAEYGVPWHGLGTAVEGKISAGGIMEKAGMLYQMELFPMVANLPDGTQLKTGAAGIFSSRTGEWEYLNTVKRAENYQIVQNAEIAEILDASTEGKPALSELFDVDTAGILNGGKHTFIALRMGENSVKLGIDGDDNYVSYTLIFNDFSGSGQLQWAIAVTRPVCVNTCVIALSEAEQGGTLWNFPHRSNPLAMLKYRAELEKNLQTARESFFGKLQQMVEVKWDQSKMESFVGAMYPDPKLPSKVSQRDAGVGLNIPEAIFNPVKDMGDTAEKQYKANLQRAQDNRDGLSSRIAFYADSFGFSKYTAYQAGTDWIPWKTPERGDMDAVGESILFSSRRIEMDRMNRLLGLLPSKKKSEAVALD